jgi:hypothetical protein
MDYKQYLEYKKKGAATLMRADDGTVYVLFKTFDHLTGEQLPDRQASFDFEELQSIKADLESNLEAVDTIMEDINALPASNIP